LTPAGGCGTSLRGDAQRRGMMGRHFRAALAAVIVLAAVEAALAQAPMPTNNPEALANVRESKQYNAVMRSNSSFRQKRMQIECGPITDPQLHASCLASFQAYK
jgi:hypothetical protein